MTTAGVPLRQVASPAHVQNHQQNYNREESDRLRVLERNQFPPLHIHTPCNARAYESLPRSTSTLRVPRAPPPLGRAPCGSKSFASVSTATHTSDPPTHAVARSSATQTSTAPAAKSTTVANHCVSCA